MMSARHRIGSALLGAALGITCVTPALADDTEIYVSNASSPANVRPNIMFIVDTSGSMGAVDAKDERKPYNSKTTYSTNGTCKSGRIFFRKPGDAMPDCSSTSYIVDSTTYNHCATMTAATKGISGRWIGKAAAFDDTAKVWRDLQPNGLSEQIECLADSGVHGSNAAPTPNVYAKNGDKTNRWTKTASAVIDWTQRGTYTFYSANWLNWRTNTSPDQTITRLNAVKQAVIDLASSIDGVNLGLMRYSNNGGSGDTAARGGMVVWPASDVTTGRDDIIATVNGFAAAGFTPLSETLYEAGQYFKGAKVVFGDVSSPVKSIASSRQSSDTTSYQSPIVGECQKNFVVYLTDGLPTQDNEADAAIATLAGRASCTGPDPGDPSIDVKDGRCMDDMAEYLRNSDLSSTLKGDQTVTTYTIGFGSDVKGASFLSTVADLGGGKRFDAGNSEELSDVLTNITSDVLDTGSTFTTASVSVNAFNRATTRDDLYFAVFGASDSLRWDGNLKKFKLAVDKSTTPPSLVVSGQGTVTDAIDPATGFFKDTTQSFWSTDVDGNDIGLGGAASQLPDPAARKIYTYLGANPKGSSAAMVQLTDTSVNDAVLGTTATPPTRADILDFAYAKDNKRIGDPLHSEPAVVTYGGTATDPKDVVFVATNDGFVHAVDAADASGVEKWAFIPKELLSRLKSLYDDPNVVNRTYGLDGDLRVLRLDLNQNGIIEPANGDVVWLYIGMRRGGRYYYALDVTNPDNPKILWINGGVGSGHGELPGLGETWSAPNISRASITGATQNAQKLVLIFGGGYDGAQENYKQVDDSQGNRIFMVDAKTGALLWYAAGTSGDQGSSTQTALRLQLADMKSSIPGRVTVIDTNGDLFADRLYTADMGGRVWRFDIFNDSTVDKLVTGGVFAELGQGGVATPADAQTRRFYNAPDVALIQRRGEDPYYNIAIGSGYRGHPLDKVALDRIYSLRDKQPFAKLTQTQYGSLVRLTDGSLPDITSDPSASTVDAASPGWKFRLTNLGEKVLAETTTVNGVILASTFQPTAPSVTAPCRPTTLNRVYAFKVDNGKPALDLNEDGKITNEDMSQTLAHDGILGKVNVGLLRGQLAAELGATSTAAGPPTVCLAGMHILSRCVQVQDSVRTYWRKDFDTSN